MLAGVEGWSSSRQGCRMNEAGVEGLLSKAGFHPHYSKSA